MKKIALMFFVIGILIVSYPYFQGHSMEVENKKEVEHFYVHQVEEPVIEKAALLKEMQEYNEKIYLEKQKNLTDPWAYETAGIDLSELEDGVVGVLKIEKIDLEMPVYLGASYENMAKGATVLGQTSMPIGGINTNCVIAGHRGWSGAAYFRYITDLDLGEIVELTNPWETMKYKVIETRIIDPNDVDQILIREGKDILTLLTCHPYASGGKQRYVVFCERI